MRRTSQPLPRQISRAKVGLSLLIAVLVALTAGQIAASQPISLASAFQEVSP